jgi:tRNA (guanine-N7-)-methyltransferase
MNDDTPERQRRIRSYVIRGGRMTAAQEQAYSAHWSKWGLSVDQGLVDIEAEFGRSACRVLEIGFGMGASLAEMAEKDSNTDFIGVEVHPPGVGKLMHIMNERGIDNIRIFCHDAVEVIQNNLEDSSFDTIQIFFPDPWHKKRHHKRRLIQPEFMLELLNDSSGYLNLSADRTYIERPSNRPLTKFEQRGERLGHGVWDLKFKRIT